MLGTKIAEGREAEVFAGPDDSVVKVFRPGFSGHLGEAAALRALAGTGVAPLLLDTIDVDGRVALVLQRLDGIDMLALVPRKPSSRMLAAL